MTVEQFDTGFGTGERRVGQNTAELSFDPSLAEQFRLYFDAQNKQRRQLGALLLDRLDERNQDAESTIDVISQVAGETGVDTTVVHYAWIALYARGEVLPGPDGRTVTARSQETVEPE